MEPGSELCKQGFLFDPAYRPLNHGSYGAFPKIVQTRQREIQDQTEARSDPFIRFTIPKLLRESREAIAPLLGASLEEVVFLPNATTGINTVLRNLKYGAGDIILYLSTAYGACEKTINHVCETSLAQAVKVEVNFPIEDEDLVSMVSKTVRRLTAQHKRVRIAMFDTVATFPGVTLPWERLTHLCKELGVLSLIDGAHGIGQIDLTKLGAIVPDFFTSNCYKLVYLLVMLSQLILYRWLYTPRGCAVLYVPFRNQHLIRSTFPTSHGFKPLSELDSMRTEDKPLDPLGDLFYWAATIDMSPYLCITEALKFRERLGGEEVIRQYCFDLADRGGKIVADVLDTEVMDNQSRTLSQCCFTMVRLPLKFASEESSETSDKAGLTAEDGPKVVKWIMDALMYRFQTWIPGKFYCNAIWMRISAQVYLVLQAFEWAAHVLKELCDEVQGGYGPESWKNSTIDDNTAQRLEELRSRC